MKKRKKLIPKIRAPRGFFFKIRKEYWDRELEYVRVELLVSETKQKIGHVNLERMCQYMATHSWLDEVYRNKKFGVLIYARAIQWALENGFKVRSGGPSEEAQRVWRGQSIRKYFRIRTYNTRDYNNNFFAYAK